MEALFALLAGAGGAAAIKFFESITLWVLNRRAKLTDEQREDAQAEEARQEQEQRELVDTVQSLKTAQRVILHDRIKYLGKCFIHDGVIDVEDLGDLIDMHKIYHDDLDGNGKLDRIMAEVKKLPIKQ